MKDPSSLLRPRPLARGDRVAIVAPASTFDHAKAVQGKAILESWGLKVSAPSPSTPHRYLADTDAERSRRLTDAFENPDIKAVIAARGGFGTARLHGRFRAQCATAWPKIFVGYSDLTVLLWRLRTEAGLVAFHGPMAASDLPRLDQEQLERFRRFLFGQDGWWKGDGLTCRNAGQATGRLVGGCLSVLATMIGTPYDVDTRGGVLFLEDTGEDPYRIDRLLTQLRHAGKFDEVAAVVLGNFHNCDSADHPGMLTDIIDEILVPVGVPIVSGFDAGHGSGCVVLPMGCQVAVDARRGSIELLEPVFAVKQAAAPSGSRDELARMAAAALRRGPGR